MDNDVKSLNQKVEKSFKQDFKEKTIDKLLNGKNGKKQKKHGKTKGDEKVPFLATKTENRKVKISSKEGTKSENNFENPLAGGGIVENGPKPDKNKCETEEECTKLIAEATKASVATISTTETPKPEEAGDMYDRIIQRHKQK